MRVLIFAMLPMLALAPTAHANADPPQSYTITAPENVWDIAAEDLNLDGIQDLLVLCCDERSDPLRKLLLVYFGSAEGYATEPSSVLRLPEDSGALFLAEVDGTAPRELVAAQADGAQIFRFKQDGFHEGRKVSLNSLFPTRAKEPVFLKSTAVDLDGDGKDEWLVPVPSGYEVHSLDKVRARITCDVVSEVRRGESVSITNRLPAVQHFQLPGEDRKALAFLSDEYADFAYGPEWKKRKRVRIPINLEDKWDANAKMADINNDGFPDLMVTQTRGTVNLKSMTQIYVAPEPMVYPEKPTVTIESAGSVAAPTLLDVNGDGQRDAIVIRIPFGMKNIISYFMSRKVSVDASVYLFDGTTFPAKPNYDADLSVEAPEGREQVAYAMDDFNGDGRLDLAFSKTRSSLNFYAGIPTGFIANKPFASIQMPSFGVLQAMDLNGNERKDCVLIRPGTKEQKRIDIVIF